ncbi:YggT family protein [bacterium]|nr:YggT family protein [bacterium]MBU1754565.1 YggT family protein [bacterium]
MFVFGELLCSIAMLMSMIFKMVYFILVVRMLLSWVNPDPYNQIVQAIYRITEPILAPFRRIIPPMGMIDISPIVVFLLLSFIEKFVVGILLQLSSRMG